MNLKTSLFNGALIRTSLRNLWAYPILACVLLFFNVLGAADRFVNTEYFDHSYFLNEFIFCYFLAIVSGIGLAVYLFAYLNRTNSVSFMHGFPFSRPTLYFSNLVSGLTMLAVPPIVMSIIMGLFALFSGNLQFYSYKSQYILLFLATYIIYGILAFSISCFTMTCCGNVIVSMLFTGTVIILPAALMGYFEFLSQENLYGYVTSDRMYDILQTLYIIPEQLYPAKFLIYIGAAVVFLAAAFFIYKVRPLENSGEVVAFKKLRALFILAVGLVCGMISYLLFNMIVSGNSLLWMLPLGLLGIIIANMFVRKSLGLRGSLIYIVIFTLLVLCGVACFEGDITGYETRIPDVSDIEYMEVDIDGRTHSYHARYHDELKANPVSVPDYTLRDAGDIEKLRALHKAYIDDKDMSFGYRHYNTYHRATINYKLKNGFTVKRSYRYLSYEKYMEYMLPVYDIYNIKNREYPIIDTMEKELISMSVGDNRTDSSKILAGSSEEAQLLLKALKNDIMNNSAYKLSNSSNIYISLSYYIPLVYENGKSPATHEEKRELDFSDNIYIGESFTETIKALESIGFEFTDENTLGKIKTLEISFIDDYREKFGDMPLSEAVEYGYIDTTEVEEYRTRTVTIDDPSDIRRFYELTTFGYFDIYSDEMAEELLSFSLIFYDEYNNDVVATSLEIPFSKLPEEIMHYFAE